MEVVVSFQKKELPTLIMKKNNSSCYLFVDPSDPGNMHSNGHGEHFRSHQGGPKTWTQEDMDLALDALRNHSMSLTKVMCNCFVPDTNGVFSINLLLLLD